MVTIVIKAISVTSRVPTRCQQSVLFANVTTWRVTEEFQSALLLARNRVPNLLCMKTKKDVRWLPQEILSQWA